jgi:Family of unknown function (DUF6184)
MKVHGGTVVLAILSIRAVNCDHNDETGPAREPRVVRDRSTSEQRRIDERRADQRGNGRSIGGGPTEPASAVAKIAFARCDREVRCDEVGTRAHEKYSSRADCDMRVQEDKREDINQKDCPGGIDNKQLDACLAAIRDEACGAPLDSISRLPPCQSGSICLK